MLAASLTWVNGASCLQRTFTVITKQVICSQRYHLLHRGFISLHSHATSSARFHLPRLHLATASQVLSKSKCSRCNGPTKSPLWFTKRIFTSTCRRGIKSPSSQVSEGSGQQISKGNSKSKLPKLTDVKRLFSLAEPEKWRLAGEY